jgi:hypothetical protein
MLRERIFALRPHFSSNPVTCALSSPNGGAQLDRSFASTVGSAFFQSLGSKINLHPGYPVPNLGPVPVTGLEWQSQSPSANLFK